MPPKKKFKFEGPKPGTWDAIPEEMTELILSFAPLEEMPSWRRVCKSWQACTERASFWYLVKKNQSENRLLKCIPTRIWISARPEKCLLPIFAHKLLQKNLLKNHTGEGGWRCLGGARVQTCLIPGNDECVQSLFLPPGSKAVQTINLDQAGLCANNILSLGKLWIIFKIMVKCPEDVPEENEHLYLRVCYGGDRGDSTMLSVASVRPGVSHWEPLTFTLEYKGGSNIQEYSSNNTVMLRLANIQGGNNDTPIELYKPSARVMLID